MMRLAESLEDAAYQKIEPHAEQEMAELRAQLNRIDDHQQREAVSNAALAYAHALSDAALVVGWQMRADPGQWLFAEQE